MKRFVSIWFPHFVTDWFCLHNPALKTVPFVVKAPSHGRMIITAASPLALQQGIHSGTALADARAIYPSLIDVDDKPCLAPKLLNRIAEWCIRFTPVAAVDPPSGIILDATGCAHLWGGDDAYLQYILKKIHAKGYHAKAAMADTIGAAWALARYQNQTLIIQPGKHIDALIPLPPAALRVEDAVVRRLEQLGLSCIKDLVAMPKTALRRRFGNNIIQRLAQAFGTAEEYIQGVQPVEPYCERLPCLGPIARLEGIEIAVEKLLGELCKKLNTEDKGIRVATLACYTIDGKMQSVQVSTSAPSGNPAHLFHLFSLKFSSIEPGPGIELFTLTVEKIEDNKPGQQQFWKDATRLDAAAISEFIDRIAARVGTAGIHRYLPAEHYLPEKSFTEAKTLTEQPATTWHFQRPRRPVCLLPQPEIIEVTAPIPDYPPMMFRYKGRLHKIIKADGPERIEQEWWLRDGRHRDYYAIEDEAGCRYWLFRSGHYDAAKTHKWFIHGFFA